MRFKKRAEASLFSQTYVQRRDPIETIRAERTELLGAEQRGQSSLKRGRAVLATELEVRSKRLGSCSSNDEV